MMKGNYNIRLIENNDVLRFVQIIRESFKKEHFIPSIYRSKGIEKFIESELNNIFSPYRYFGFYYNDGLVGCAEFKIVNAHTFFLNQIATNNNFKGKGVGSTLLKYALDYFSSRGYKSTLLDVYEDNEIAFSWYSSLGYIELERKYFYKLIPTYSETHKYYLFIQNYPQYKSLTDYFGFNFLDVIINNEIIRIGVIDNDLILRGDYNEFSKYVLNYIGEKLNYNNLFFICNDIIKDPELKLLNQIIRMELILKK